MSDSTAFGPIDNLRSQLQHVTLPPEDRLRSPHTGLTRDHWVAIADDMLLSVARFATPGGSRFLLPGPVSQQGVPTDGLEAFARTFLMAAFLVRGQAGSDPHGHLSRYLQGLRVGTATWGDGAEDSWAAIGHVGRDGQPHVEAASIALSLHLTKQWTWERLSPVEQENVASWLSSGLDKEPSSNNWYLFPTTIASFLEGVGRGDDHTSAVIDRGLTLIEQWYRGDGWYSDGEGAAFDHYIGWAMHLYPLLHAWLRGDESLSKQLTARLREFLDTYALTFDRNGAPLHQGRSLTYRMGTLAAVAMGEVLDATPLRPGQSRRILSATLRYFLERGATADGVLTLGWHGPHSPTVQPYSGPGSPYWASKGFAALLLGADHPLWQSTEETLVGERDHVVVVRPAGLMIQTTAVDGMVRVHNHGSDHLKPHQADDGLPDPLYARFAYSTRTGPTPLGNPSDNDVQVAVRGVWSVRRRIHAAAAGPDWVASWHAPRFPVPAPFDASPSGTSGPVLPSARIESVTAARGGLEVRIHRLQGVPAGAPIRLSGYAVAAEAPERFDVDTTSSLVTVTGDQTGTGISSMAPARLISQIAPLYGFDSCTEQIAPAGTAYGRWAVLPVAHGSVPTDGPMLPTVLLVAAVRLGSSPDDAITRLTARVSGGTVSIDWGDEQDGTVIDLDAIAWT